MPSDDAKTSPAPQNETAVKKEAVAKKDEGQPKDKTTSDADLSKAEGGEKAANSPSGYSRGEGQKPVSKAYKDNWNAIYGKKKKKKRQLDQWSIESARSKARREPGLPLWIVRRHGRGRPNAPHLVRLLRVRNARPIDRCASERPRRARR
jgi:hypothetical protein